MRDEDPARLGPRLDDIVSEQGHGLSLVVCDAWLPDNPIVFVSPEFSSTTGYTPAEVVGRNCRFLQGPGTEPAAVEELRRAIREERPTEVRILNYRKDGRAFWNALSIRPAYDRNGRLTSFIGVLRDLSGAVEAPALEAPWLFGDKVGPDRQGLVSRFEPLARSSGKA